MRPILLLMVVAAATLAPAPTQSQGMPDAVEILSVALPGSELSKNPHEVAVEARYEFRDVMLRSRRYYAFLSASPKSPTKPAAFTIPKDRSALVELHKKTGTVRFAASVDALLEAGSGNSPLVLSVHLIERPDWYDNPRGLGIPRARSKPVAVYLGR